MLFLHGIVTHIYWDTYDQFFENTNSPRVGENINETNTEEVTMIDSYYHHNIKLINKT